MSFTRTKESFTCEHCGRAVIGNGYTNHCPNCLWSKHVDLDPGDRAASCQGVMRPMAVRYQNEAFTILLTCQRCGFSRPCKASATDNRDELIRLTATPLPDDK